MHTGIVKFFDAKKGYGFITPDGGGKDVFAHYSEVKAEGFKVLQEGQRVSYVPSNGPKGQQATNIHIVEE